MLFSHFFIVHSSQNNQLSGSVTYSFSEILHISQGKQEVYQYTLQALSQIKTTQTIQKDRQKRLLGILNLLSCLITILTLSVSNI